MGQQQSGLLSSGAVRLRVISSQTAEPREERTMTRGPKSADGVNEKAGGGPAAILRAALP